MEYLLRISTVTMTVAMAVIKVFIAAGIYHKSEIVYELCHWTL